MVDLKMSIEEINHINALITRDEALPVIPDKTEPEKWGKCPKCLKLTARSNGNNFCVHCGQRLDVENDAL
jgi:hypothetical protein